MTLTTDAPTGPPATTERAATAPRGPDRVVALALPWVLTVVAAYVVLADVTVPVLRPVAGLFLLMGVPTWVLAHRLHWPFETRVHAWVLSFGVTMFGVIAGGLALNALLPGAGIDRPLAERPVTIAATLVSVGLLSWRVREPLVQSAPADWVRAVATLRWRLVPTLAVVNVAAAVLGAIRLNNDASGALAVLGHVGVAVLLGVVLFARTDDLRRDVVAVYAAGLSLLLATSVRGWYISGHDVQREFISFQLTYNSGRWSMADYPTAYHACLSVNILPTAIAHLTDLSGYVIFKVVLQLFAAVIPVIVLLLARLVVERRLAIAAVCVFVGFPTFSNDLAYLTRQEAAFLFLGLAFLVATQTRFSVNHRRVMVGLFGIGVVLSHYSTTYLMVAALCAGLFVLIALAWWDRWRARGRGDEQRAAVPLLTEPLVVLYPGVIVALVLSTFIWVSPVTNSGGHLLDTATESISKLLHGGGDDEGSSDLGYSIIPGQTTPDSVRLQDFADTIVEQREANTQASWLLPLTQGIEEPTSTSMSLDPLTGVGRVINVVFPVQTLNTMLRLGSAFALQVLLVVGLLALVLRRAAGVRDLPDQTRAMMVGSLAGVAMVVLVPGLSGEYGVLRAFQQGFVLLAPVVVIGAMTLLHLVRPLARRAMRLVQVGAIALVVVLSGVVSTATGGSFGILALANSGPYHEIHYVTGAEVAGYRWIGQNAGGRIVQAEVISDKLAANRLVYNPDGGVLVASDMFPASLLSESAVFLGPDTVHHGYAAEFYTGTLLTYEFPKTKVERHLDVVFSSPDAQIYWPGPGR
jgi:uncharacterized membrane protein